MSKTKIVNKSGFPNPEYKTNGSSGFDIQACLMNEGINEIVIHPLQSSMIGTGIYVQIEQGKELQIRSRSGLSSKEGLIVLNQPGTVDSDYRGEVRVVIFNTSSSSKVIKHGDRIAQGVITNYYRADWENVEFLDDSDRNEGGFGHTGK